jgi:hypothetical protein
MEANMASTLNPGGEARPNTTRGHGTRALGPSDSSDTGSDVVGGPGLGDLDPLDLDRGTTSDPDRAGSAGADLGDANLDSDSDRSGTGENSAAGRDPAQIDRDIAPDSVREDPDVDDDVLAKQEHEEEPDPTAQVADADNAAAEEDPDAVPTIDTPPAPRASKDKPLAA